MILMGLPWLHSIKAVIDIGNFNIQISDPSIGNQPVVIQSPLFMKSTEHSLLLVSAETPNHQFAQLSMAHCQPVKKTPLAPAPEVEAQSDTDDDADTESMESEESDSTVSEDDYSSEESSDDDNSLN
jgi:hypothetical protein